MRRFFRRARVLTGLAPFVVAFLRDRRRWILAGRPARRSTCMHQRRADQLVARLAALGPAFIKLAQALSARADIFPEPYLAAIGTLEDQAPPEDPDRIIALLEEDLDRPADEAFDEFERPPLVAASLDQTSSSGRAASGSGT